MSGFLMEGETPSDLVDAPANALARARQEALWADTNVDARQQLAAREGALRFQRRFCDAMDWYRIIYDMVQMHCESRSTYFCFLDLPLLEIVVSFLFPRQEGLIRHIGGLIVRSKEDSAVLDDKNTPPSPKGAAEGETSKPEDRENKESSNKVGRGPSESQPFKIFVRPRPRLGFENHANEYSVVRSISNHHLLLHDGKVDRTGRRLNMRHFQYTFDRVFDQFDSHEHVCAEVVAPLLSHVVELQNDSTLILYGQTGTGKTYTMSGCIEYLAQMLEGMKVEVEVCFFEIHGKNCYDLMAERKTIRLLSDASGTVHPRGVRVVKLSDTSKEGLLSVLNGALELRSIEQTERNAISSRSHAVLKLSISVPSSGNVGSNFRIVDLAGSERNYETVKMTPAMHRESADINKSLFALKDCFRAYNTISKGLTRTPYQIKVPLMSRLNVREKERKAVMDVSNRPMKSAPVRLNYRAHMLTRVLRQCFCDSKHKTFIVACLSPTSTDIEHSLNTLDHVSLMNKNLEHKKSVASVSVPMFDGVFTALKGKPISKWTAEEVSEWVGVVDGGAFAHIVLPPNLTGALLMSLGKVRLSTLFTHYERQARREGEGYAWAESATVDDSALTHRLFELIRNKAVEDFVFRE
jgi:kinesin family member 2/24